jgi:hypothetical protein
MILSKKNLIKLSLAFLIVSTLLILSVAAQSPTTSTDQTPNKDNEKIVYRLANMHTHPWFWEVLASSAVGWLLGLVKGFSGAKDWLATYWSKTPKAAILILDMLIFIGVGAYAGTGIYNPTSFFAAMGAGITWPVGLGAIATKPSTGGTGGPPPPTTPTDGT